jgi:hypothetical protein
VQALVERGAQAGLERPLRLSMRGEGLAAARIQGLQRRASAIARAKQTRTRLHSLMKELATVFDAAVGLQKAYRNYLWRRTSRWWVTAAMHFVAAAVQRAYRRHAVRKAERRRRKVLKKLTGLEVEFATLRPQMGQLRRLRAEAQRACQRAREDRFSRKVTASSGGCGRPRAARCNQSPVHCYASRSLRVRDACCPPFDALTAVVAATAAVAFACSARRTASGRWCT